MSGWVVIAVTVAAVASSSAVAAADPDPPRPGTPCWSDLVGAMTWPTGDQAPLVCASQPIGTTWETVATPYPASDLWYSPGAAMTLRGGARQNPAIEPGDWTATPLDADGRCRAEQLTVTYGKIDGPPRIDESDPGLPLSFPVLPRLLTVEMSGNCLWEKIPGTG